jgi:hypothetical protein
MKKFIKTIKKKTQGKGSYDPQEAAATGGASGGTEAGYEVREKDLPKLHKAAWTGDLSKVVQLVKKDTSSLDKENRYFGADVFYFLSEIEGILCP